MSYPCTCGKELRLMHRFDEPFPDGGPRIAYNLFACNDCGSLLRESLWEHAGVTHIAPDGSVTTWPPMSDEEIREAALEAVAVEALESVDVRVRHIRPEERDESAESARYRLCHEVLELMRPIFEGPTRPKRNQAVLDDMRLRALDALRHAEETWLGEIWPEIRFDVELHEHPQHPGHFAIDAVRIFEDRPGEVRWR